MALADPAGSWDTRGGNAIQTAVSFHDAQVIRIASLCKDRGLAVQSFLKR